MTALPSSYDPYTNATSVFARPRRQDAPIRVAPRTMRLVDHPAQQAQQQQGYNQSLALHNTFANRPPQYPTALPSNPVAENNIAANDVQRQMQQIQNQQRAAAFARAQDSVLTPLPSQPAGPPAPGQTMPVSYLPTSQGDGSFTHNVGLNPSAPAVYKLPSLPQQQGPEFDDYTIRAWHQYNQQFPNDRRSLRDFATTFKPAQDQLDQQANAAYANPNYGKSYDQVLAETRQQSAANVAGVKAAMTQFPPNRPGGPSAPPSALPVAPPAPANVTATPAAPSAAPQLPQTPTYSNNAVQGVGVGHLPGSDRVQGADLDRLGAQYGIPRGRTVINGIDYGPRSDADYAGLIRAHVGQIADADLKHNPDYVAAQNRMNDIKTAQRQGVGVSTIDQQKAYAGMSPSERLSADMQNSINQIQDPERRAKAIQAYQSFLASTGTNEAKAEETARHNQATEANANHKIDMQGYAEFGKNVTNIAKSGINAFTRWIDTNIRTNAQRDIAANRDASRERIASSNNDTKTAIADQTDTTRNKAIDSRNAYNNAKLDRLSDLNKRKIALQVEKMTDIFAKSIQNSVPDEAMRAKAIAFHRNALLRSAGLDDWVVGEDGKLQPKANQATTPTAPTQSTATPAPAPQPQLAVGAPHAGSVVVQTGTAPDGRRVYELQDNRIVDANGNTVQ